MLMFLLCLACAGPAAVAPSVDAPPVGGGGATVPADAAPPPGDAVKAPMAPTEPLVLGEADASGNDVILAPTGGTPDELYAGCRDRVEGDEKAGECTTNADCSTAGCSGEVCTTKALAPNINTICDVQPCFAVLETCGCTNGTCSWTVRKAP